jgi:hypothetical protein
MREAFVFKRFRESSLAVIDQANAIIDEYREKGFTLTLRQLYYQFVARDLIANKQSEYKRLGSIINDARLAGHIDWSAIEDRTRYLRHIQTYNSPRELIARAAKGYAENVWADQPYYCEVWIEKDALVGVIERVCNRWRVPYFPCRGYNSQSEQYEAGKRLDAANARGKRVIVFHLGDHDPSGIDMTNDNRDRLRMFSASSVLTVQRLALNREQVDRYNPPPNPAKDTDSRFEEYRRQHGEHCWELDALNPEVIENLIEENIQNIINTRAFNAALRQESASENAITRVADHWSEVYDFLETL